MKRPIVIKENGRKQRGDVALTKEVTSLLVQKIFLGESLFTSTGASGYITFDREEGQEPLQLAKATLNTWIKRNSVIPETGQTLRRVLDEAREKYRTMEREKLHKNLLNKVEHELSRTMQLRTNVPVVGMFGLIKDKDGNVVRKENHNLLRVKMDTAKFLAEALDPARYGKKTDNKHLVMTFSLADLRRVKEENKE